MWISSAYKDKVQSYVSRLCDRIFPVIPAEMAAAGGHAAVSPQTKPEVYRRTDGKIIVQDELLNFLAIKMRTLGQDDIVLLATNNLSSEWIESSKKLLFESCPNTTQRCVS